MLTIVLNEKKTQTAQMTVYKDVVSNATERLTAIGIYDELKKFKTALDITDGRLTRLVRKVVSCAYEYHEPRLIDDLVKFFAVFKTAKFGAAIKAACESAAFITFESGRAKIGDYSKKSRAEKALSSKSFGVLLNFEQAQQAMASQRALERKQSVIKQEKLESGATKEVVAIIDRAKAANAKDLEDSKAMGKDNPNKELCIAFCNKKAKILSTLSVLMTKVEKLSADKADELLKKIEDMNA